MSQWNKKKVFKVEHEEYEGECGVCNPPVVTMSSKVEDKVMALMAKYPHTEWLGYLLGDGFHIEDMIIPKQEVSVAAVEVKEFPQDMPNIIGVIHSHHNMGNFHSSTDNEYLVGNHNVSIVATSDGKFEVKARVLTPCNKLLVRKVEVSMVRERIATDQFVKEAEGQIEEKKYHYGKQGAYGYYPYQGEYEL